MPDPVSILRCLASPALEYTFKGRNRQYCTVPVVSGHTAAEPESALSPATNRLPVTARPGLCSQSYKSLDTDELHCSRRWCAGAL